MNVAVIFYSLYGNTATLAAAVAAGAEQAGATVRLRQVPELIHEEQGTRPPPRWTSDPIRTQRERLAPVPLARNEDLLWADGVAFGSPARYGAMCAQLKHFIDGFGKRWLADELPGKVAGVFCATLNPEAHASTLRSMMIPLFYLGFLIQGHHCAEHEPMSTAELLGGSLFRAPSAGGLRPDHPPTEADLTLSRALGHRLALAAGRLRG